MSRVSFYEFQHGSFVCSSVLGIINRTALWQGPPLLRKFFQRDVSVRFCRSDRTSPKHYKCLIDLPTERNLEIMRRSALGSDPCVQHLASRGCRQTRFQSVSDGPHKFSYRPCRGSGPQTAVSRLSAPCALAASPVDLAIGYL